jgi:glycosyltransferase involved in cell wall biosynthesis
LQKLKLHVQIHTDIFSPYFKNIPLQYIRMIIAPLIIRSADALRCDSKRMADVIVKRNISRAPVQVLPIFIDVKKYDLAQEVKNNAHDLFPEKRFVILMASRLELEKEISMAIDIFANVLLKYPKQIGLVIIGSGSLEVYLQKQVRSSGLDHDVVFVPWTNELLSYYRTSDIFLMTSRFEGYGLTLAESLLCGTPVLTTDVGVAPEIVIPGQTGWICPPQDRACFEKKLHEIMENPALYQETKNYLIQHPYMHAYGDYEYYQKLFFANIADALK